MLIDSYRANREGKMQREKTEQEWIAWEDRHIQTYISILGEVPKGPVLDIGAGANHLVRAFNARNVKAEGIDFDRANFEKDTLPFKDNLFESVILNAVIEHIRNPDTMMREISRVVVPGGLIIVRTPNWQMDYKNFYNDPTHVKPYTPEGLATLLSMYGFETFFSGPALVCKPKILFKLPTFIKWQLAKYMRGGTRSMLLIAKNTKK